MRWDIALRDLDVALDLDSDADGKLTWGEVRAAWPRIETYALQRLSDRGLRADAPIGALERRNDGAYAVLFLRSSCTLPAPPRIRYGLFADVDPTHRGIAKMQRAWAGGRRSRCSSRARRAAQGATGAGSAAMRRGRARRASRARRAEPALANSCSKAYATS